jgi:hypothetical protein
MPFLWQGDDMNTPIIQVRQIDPKAIETFKNLLRREGSKTQITRIAFVLRQAPKENKNHGN